MSKEKMLSILHDDGGENWGLMKRLQSSDWKMPIRFEFTGRDTLQRNHLAKVALSTIAGRGRAIMSAAKIPKNMRHVFWQEAFQTATLMDSLIIIEVEGNKKKQDSSIGKVNCPGLLKIKKNGVKRE
jgi:hypothetical protein